MYGIQGGIGDTEPAAVHLLQNMPNPFAASTTIAFELAAESNATILVYDLQGRLVKEILSERMPAGAHSVSWDGRDASGRAATGGVYFYSIQTDRGIEARRMVLVR